MEIDEEKLEQALKYQHDVGFDEGYEMGWECGYQIGYDEGVDSMEAEDADKRWNDEQQS